MSDISHKDRFHDLRSTLGVIVNRTRLAWLDAGKLEFLINDCLDRIEPSLRTEEREYLGTVLAQVFDSYISMQTNMNKIARIAEEGIDTTFEEPQKKDTNVKYVLENIVQDLKPIYRIQGIRLISGFTDGPRINMPQRYFKSMIMNLLDNSVKAVNGKSNKEIQLSAHYVKNTYQIMVYDNGCGIDDLEDAIKEGSSGTDSTGIGLSTVMKYKEKYGFELETYSEPGSTYFIMRFKDVTKKET